MAYSVEVMANLQALQVYSPALPADDQRAADVWCSIIAAKLQ